MRIQGHRGGDPRARDGDRPLHADGGLRELEMVPVRQPFRRGLDRARQPSVQSARKNRLAALTVVSIAVLTLAASGRAPAAGPAITVSGTTLQLNGQPTFLLGASFFGALDVASPRDRD